MFSDEQNDVLSLLAATIFADKHVYVSEIDMFTGVVLELTSLSQTTPELSEAKVLTWYEMNKDDIRQKVIAPYFKDWFYSLLDRISKVEDKPAILTAMEKISLADGSVHVGERTLIMLAKQHWKLD